MKLIYQFKEIYRKFGEKRNIPDILKHDYNIPSDIKKSLKLRCIDAGSDEGILAELYSLEGPYYSLESYGISFTASPKHADGLFIVGGISNNMKQAVIDAWEVVPNPKVLIACGNEAINGDDIFGEKLSSVEEVLGKVDLKIPGNPSSKDIFNYLVSFIK